MNLAVPKSLSHRAVEEKKGHTHVVCFLKLLFKAVLAVTVTCLSVGGRAERARSYEICSLSFDVWL